MIVLTSDDCDVVDAEFTRRERHDRGHRYADNRSIARVDAETRADWGWLGVAAEMATAIAVWGRENWQQMWTGRGGDPKDDRADVAPDIEIKWSSGEALLLKDLPGRRRTFGPHVLVNGRNPFFVQRYYPVTEVDYQRPLENIGHGLHHVPSRVIRREELLPIEDLIEHYRAAIACPRCGGPVDVAPAARWARYLIGNCVDHGRMVIAT